jgi:probable HAF family extracellular repeat protein
MVAAYTTNGARVPVRIERNGDITQIELLKGDVAGEALGINAAGTVVGFSDDPSGPTGGPQPFVWRNGVTRLLELPETSQFGAATAINDRGQIAGMLDVEMPNPEKTSDANAEETIFKTLAFRWSPVPGNAKPTD